MTWWGNDVNEGKATQSLKVTSVHLEKDINSQDQGGMRWDKAGEATIVSGRSSSARCLCMWKQLAYYGAL